MFPSELSFRIFLLIMSYSVMILILVFSSLRKVRWKPIIALLSISRALDIGITLLAFQRMGHAELEANPIIIKLYFWLGFNNLFFLACILVWIGTTLGLAWLIKILIGCKNEWFNFFGYFFGYIFTIASFVAFIDWLVFLL